jgi:hypothetical protein
MATQSIRDATFAHEPVRTPFRQTWQAILASFSEHFENELVSVEQRYLESKRY